MKKIILTSNLFGEVMSHLIEVDDDVATNEKLLQIAVESLARKSIEHYMHIILLRGMESLREDLTTKK